MFGLTGLAARRIVHAAAITVASLVLVITANGAAKSETRTLNLYHVHLRETSSITYKRNGRFIPDGLKQANWALRDWRESKPTNMDPHLLDMLWEVSRRTGARGPVHIIGGYRSPNTNRTLRSRSSGVAENSQHTRGKAIDFFIPGVPLSRVRDAAMQLQIGGVGYYPRSGSPFVHIDTGTGRYWPRMGRRELAGIFPKGNTIYVPSDGKPLPGYETALASYNQRRSGASVQMADARTGGRGFLARLFGGGSEEAEDQAEADATPVPGRSAPARRAPEPQVQVAAAPAPSPAARPTAMPAGVAMPDRETFDTTGRNPVPRAGIPETAVASLTRVPVPTAAVRAPASAVPAAAPPEAEILVAAAEPAPSPAAPGQLAYAVPTPSRRPPFEAVLQAGAVPLPVATPEGQAVAAATLGEDQADAPTTMAEVLTASLEPENLVTPTASPLNSAPFVIAPAPTAEPETASEPIPSALLAALQADAARIEAEGLPATPAVESLESIAREPEPVLAGKGGRVRAAGAARSGSTPVAIEEAIASRIEVASLVTSPERRALEGRSNLPKAGMLVVDVPVTVLASGFAPKGEATDSSRFTGSAVTFLPVRKVQ